jgi:hypothetical protein
MSGVLISAASTLGHTLKGDLHLDPTINLRLLETLDARIDVKLGGSTGVARLLGGHRFTDFASGEATHACPSNEALADLHKAVNTVKPTDELVVLAVGGTDRDPLGPALRRQRESNTGLARARVDTALACLRLAPPAGTPMRQLPLVTGPAYTPPRDASASAAAQAMQADRAVELHVLAVPRTR